MQMTAKISNDMVINAFPSPFRKLLPVLVSIAFIL